MHIVPGSKIDFRDDRINMCSPYSVAQWTGILDVTIAQLTAGVLEVGNCAKTVKAHLSALRGKPGAAMSTD
jgi:Protein of unknown function (DUF3606)